jgi:hypothetical protein
MKYTAGTFLCAALFLSVGLTFHTLQKVYVYIYAYIERAAALLHHHHHDFYYLNLASKCIISFPRHRAVEIIIIVCQPGSSKRDLSHFALFV